MSDLKMIDLVPYRRIIVMARSPCRMFSSCCSSLWSSVSATVVADPFSWQYFPGQGFLVQQNPDSDLNFWWLKIEQISFEKSHCLIKNCNLFFLFLGLHAAMNEALKTWKFFTFFLFSWFLFWRAWIRIGSGPSTHTWIQRPNWIQILIWNSVRSYPIICWFFVAFHPSYWCCISFPHIHRLLLSFKFPPSCFGTMFLLLSVDVDLDATVSSV